MTIIADRNGCIEYVNRKFTEVTGFVEEDVCGQQMVQFYQTDSTNNAYEELWETVTVGQEWQGELRPAAKTIRLLGKNVGSSVLEDNGDLSSVVVMQEISQSRNNMSKVCTKRWNRPRLPMQPE